MTQAGSEVRRYRIEDVLEKSTFGTYYRADRESAGGRSPVVVKVLCDDLQRDIEHLKGLRRLHRALRAAEHPGLVPTEGPLELDGKLVVVSDYVEGMPLREILDAESDRTIPVDVALGIVQQIAEILAAVHASRDPRGRDILPVHRDVRPGNVLLTTEGDIRLVEAGVALSGFDANRMELHGGVAYLAPERLDNEESAAIDVYAMTLTFLELVIGKLPKTAASRPSDHERRILEFDDQLERLECPVGVRAMVREGLAFDPARRPSAAVLERVCHALRAGIARQEVPEWIRPRVLRLLRHRVSTPGDWSGRTLEEGARRRGTIPPAESAPMPALPPRDPSLQAMARAPAASPPASTAWAPSSFDEPGPTGEHLVSFDDDRRSAVMGSEFSDAEVGYEDTATVQRPPPPGARLDADGAPRTAPPGLASQGIGGPVPLSPMATPSGAERTDDPATVIRPKPSDMETHQRAPDRGRSPLAGGLGLSDSLDPEGASHDPETVIRDAAQIFHDLDRPTGGMGGMALPGSFGGDESSDDPATMIRPELQMGEGFAPTGDYGTDGDFGDFGDFGDHALEGPPRRRGNPLVSMVIGAIGLVFVVGLLGGVTYGITNYTTTVYELDTLCESKVQRGREFVSSTKVRPRRLAQRLLDDVESDCVDEKLSLFNTDLVVQEILRRAGDGHLTEFEDHKIRDRLRKASE